MWTLRQRRALPGVPAPRRATRMRWTQESQGPCGVRSSLRGTAAGSGGEPSLGRAPEPKGRTQGAWAVSRLQSGDRAASPAREWGTWRPAPPPQPNPWSPRLNLPRATDAGQALEPGEPSACRSQSIRSSWRPGTIRGGNTMADLTSAARLESSVLHKQLLGGARPVGGVYHLDFSKALVSTDDKWKADAGGIPQHSFLLATVLPLEAAGEPEDEEVLATQGGRHLHAPSPNRTGGSARVHHAADAHRWALNSRCAHPTGDAALRLRVPDPRDVLSDRPPGW